ncbi:MAG: UPF0280 family protein [Gammaproteobacteria bacterium]|nr:UPF0280 family protein [Gammaproteobacteria bacterium]
MINFNNIQASLLQDKLHLNHGPIDLLLQAEGESDQVHMAFKNARQRFQTVLDELVQELPLLRSELPANKSPGGEIARQMLHACSPYQAARLSPMAAVAGAVADEMLKAMQQNTSLLRCWVNNGGDIAFDLAAGQQFRCGVVADISNARVDGDLRITSEDSARGIATSGWATQAQGGRSFSLGIADAVTVLADNAANADVAATMIANQVDLPDHSGIHREMATEHDPDNDLGERLVTTDVPQLSDTECNIALERGAKYARELKANGRILFAILFLQNKSAIIGNQEFSIPCLSK